MLISLNIMKKQVNGICLCERCHDKHGHKDECSTGNLAKLVC